MYLSIRFQFIYSNPISNGTLTIKWNVSCSILKKAITWSQKCTYLIIFSNIVCLTKNKCMRYFMDTLYMHHHMFKLNISYSNIIIVHFAFTIANFRCNMLGFWTSYFIETHIGYMYNWWEHTSTTMFFNETDILGKEVYSHWRSRTAYSSDQRQSGQVSIQKLYCSSRSNKSSLTHMCQSLNSICQNG